MDIIYCFWTGDNEMSSHRRDRLNQLIHTTECKVILVTKQNLHEYILPDTPLHPAYDYLSETHKADYLRTYFMHFHGGGYCDIKDTMGSWRKAFEELRQSTHWICGYPEIQGGVAYPPNCDKWQDLIGNCAYICKPKSPLTTEWYNEMIALLDAKLPNLKLHPSRHPTDCAEQSSYPIEWNEMLGRIFHKVSYKYKEYILNSLPMVSFHNYK